MCGRGKAAAKDGDRSTGCGDDAVDGEAEYVLAESVDGAAGGVAGGDAVVSGAVDGNDAVGGAAGAVYC